MADFLGKKKQEVKKGYSHDNHVSDEEKHRMIEEAAYYIAERRGFQNGCPDEDWNQATEEVENYLKRK